MFLTHQVTHSPFSAAVDHWKGMPWEVRAVRGAAPAAAVVPDEVQ